MNRDDEVMIFRGGLDGDLASVKGDGGGIKDEENDQFANLRGVARDRRDFGDGDLEVKMFVAFVWVTGAVGVANGDGLKDEVVEIVILGIMGANGFAKLVGFE